MRAHRVPSPELLRRAATWRPLKHKWLSGPAARLRQGAAPDWPRQRRFSRLVARKSDFGFLAATTLASVAPKVSRWPSTGDDGAPPREHGLLGSEDAGFEPSSRLRGVDRSAECHDVADGAQPALRGRAALGVEGPPDRRRPPSRRSSRRERVRARGVCPFPGRATTVLAAAARSVHVGRLLGRLWRRGARGVRRAPAAPCAHETRKKKTANGRPPVPPMFFSFV